MEITVQTVNGVSVAIVPEGIARIEDVNTALDLMASVSHNLSCQRMVVHKASVSEEFFDLSSRLAGEILQKYVNYGMKLAIVGDFSGYTSKSLRDFIYESNKGTHVFFLESEQAAIERLARA